jgi:RimJ/RimL family protein N-acetyltransferase
MLKGKNITLRPLKISDWKKTIQWRNDIGIKNLALMHPFPITEMVEKQWFEDILKNKSDKIIYFAISINPDKPIGFVSLNNINYINGNCYLGIVIGEKEAQGKGFGVDAMNTIIDYTFNTLNLIKISVEVVSINEPALKLYKKLGFVEEGILRDQFFIDGAFLDVRIMSLFRNSIH